MPNEKKLYIAILKTVVIVEKYVVADSINEAEKLLLNAEYQIPKTIRTEEIKSSMVIANKEVTEDFAAGD